MIIEKRDEILELSFEFALKIIEYCELLEENCKYVIAHQLLKSCTSIGANIRKVQNAESKQDFIHKLKLQPKRQKKQNIGYFFAIKLQHIRHPKHYYHR